ncbi:MAG: ATP-dependent endonuclease [Cyanobacteria bacterium REEB67]|nr:ATP-dependent endonuclease [Cyanobacteria bacterium REEB67]
MTDQNHSFLHLQSTCRLATAEERALAAQRQLVFEEPVSRFARLKKTVQRQLSKVGRDSLKNLTSYQMAALHGGLFGPFAAPPPLSLACIVFSLALALEDFRLYSPTAFTAFAANQPYLTELDSALDRAISKLAQDIAEVLKLDNGRKQWLTVCLLATPDWSSSEDFDPNRAEISADLFHSIFDSASAIVAENIVSSGDLTTLAALQNTSASALLIVAKKVAALLKEKLRPSLVVLVEGQSELIVLPHFARLMGASLESMGALVIASGGAPQVVRRYLTLKDVLNIPIVCVFDGDAEDSSMVIEESLRECDGLITLESTELEDCYSYEQLLKILNLQLARNGQVLASEPFQIPKDGPRKNALNKLFRARGLGDFDKIAFARTTVDLAVGRDDVPTEMSRVIDYLRKVSGKSGTY